MMKKKSYFVLIACFLAMSAALMGLYLISPLPGGVYQASFKRTFTKRLPLEQRAVLNLEYNSFYIAGTANDRIYLGNTTAPLLMSFTDLSLTKLSQTRIKISGLNEIKDIGRFKLEVDSPYFYLFNGSIPLILRGDLETVQARPIMRDSGYYFDKAVAIGPSSFALRSYNIRDKSYELAKKTVDSPYFQFNNDLLEKQLDGIFCLDGQIHYSRLMKQLVYHHFYRNEVVVSDSNLNLIYRGHTIDTFSHAKIEIATLNSEGNTMLTGTPTQVNVRGCVLGKYLYLNSNLLAKNEDREMFFGNAVIDVYDLSSGSRYLKSFYIPYYRKRRPIDFIFFGRYVAAIYDQYLVLYHFDIEAIRGRVDTLSEK